MILALKLFLTPVFIASVSLAGRRWGPGVSGLLIGLPLTSGPISFILASEYGTGFAARAAVGTLAGQASVCVFCLAYSACAWRRASWVASMGAGIVAFFLATLAWDRLSPSLALASGGLFVVIVVVLRLIPEAPRAAGPTLLPRWDLPARMLLATAFVVLLTTFANALGPQLSGLISPFPVFGAVLAAFTHRQQGRAAVARLQRGVVLGSAAFGSFFLVVGGLLPVLGIGWTYPVAVLTTLAVDGLLLYLAH